MSEQDATQSASHGLMLLVVGYNGLRVLGNRSAIPHVIQASYYLVIRQNTQNGFRDLRHALQFGPGKPLGFALARWARSRVPGVKVLFLARPEFQGDAEGIGAFLPLPVSEHFRVGRITAPVAGPGAGHHDRQSPWRIH